ncbi:alpha/beta hydrolase [Myxococcota bacterium]|nr:alpha/beta hydrolase [Myxococcota bacterium]
MLGLAVGFAGIAAMGFLYESASRRRDGLLPIPGRKVDVGGYRLHATDDGAGTPVVVVITGAGDCSYSWTYVRRQVAAFARIVTYDRPGLGSSDRGPPPHPRRSVDELRTLLGELGASGPYVLVGHSLGGLMARLYAASYPGEVAGMVLVDSTHEGLWDDRAFRRGMGAVGLLLRGMGLASSLGLPRILADTLGLMPMYPELPHYRRQLSAMEYRQFAAAVHRALAEPGGRGEIAAIWPLLEASRGGTEPAAGRPPLGDMPLVVLTNPGFGDAWVAMHRELASRSSLGIQRVSDRSGHNLHMPRPDLVVEAVRDVVEAVRGRTPGA